MPQIFFWITLNDNNSPVLLLIELWYLPPGQGKCCIDRCWCQTYHLSKCWPNKSICNVCSKCDFKSLLQFFPYPIPHGGRFSLHSTGGEGSIWPALVSQLLRGLQSISCAILSKALLKGAISDHKQKKFDDISKIDGVIAIFVSRANFSEIFRFLFSNLTWP